MQSKLVQVVLLLLLSILWAGTFIFVKIGDQSLSPFTLMFGRAFLAFAFILIVAFIKHPHLIRVQWRLRSQMIFFVNGLCIAIMWFTIAKSEQVITAAMASLLLTTLVIFSWLIATFCTREKPFYIFNLIGIVLAVLGVMTMLGFSQIFNGNEKVLYALLYAFGVLIFVIGAAVIKHGGIKTSPIISTMYSLFYTMLILCICTFLFEHPLGEDYTAPAILAMLGVGLLSTGVGYLIFFSLVIYAGQVFAALNGYLVPVIGFLFGVILMDEPYQLHQIVGLFIVFVGTFMTNRKQSKSS